MPCIRVGGDEGYIIRRGTGRTVVCFGRGRWRRAINNAPSRGYGQQSDRYFPKGHILYIRTHFIYIYIYRPKPFLDLPAQVDTRDQALNVRTPPYLNIILHIRVFV